MEQLTVGENIKRLRRENCMTQEKLASVLNISPQSISKWERGDTYPDIVILPAIANYFGVTIDALLGNDKSFREEKIQRYIDDCKSGGGTQALNLAKRAYEDFPYDFRIIMLYVNMLNIYGNKDDREEMIRLCGLVVDKCTDETLLADARSHLHGLISTHDKREFLKKYIDYGQNWDWFKIYPFSTDEGKILFQHELSDKWWHLNVYIGSYYSDFQPEENSFSHEDTIKLIKKQEKIFYAFFDEDDLGEYTFYVGQFNEFLAREYAYLGMENETLDHIEKAVGGWIAYCELPEEYTYKNILIDHRPYEKESGSYYCPSRYANDLAAPIYDFVRSTGRFRCAYEKLVNYGK